MQTPEDNAASPAPKPPTAAGAADPSPPSGKPGAGAKASPDDTGTGTGSSAAANQEKPAQPRKTSKTPDIASDPGADAIDLLKADHRRVEALFAEFESASDQRKAAIIREACTELTLHTLLEEEIFYPACRAADGEETEDALDEAQVEHDCAKLLIIELLASSQDDPLQSARFKVLAEQIKHHVAEEEAPRTGVFAKATAAGVDRRAGPPTSGTEATAVEGGRPAAPVAPRVVSSTARRKSPNPGVWHAQKSRTGTRRTRPFHQR